MTILLAGASGLVGRHALDLLLGTPDYTRIVIPTRRDLAGASMSEGGRPGLLVQHPNVTQVRVNFARLDEHAADLQADHVLCALGTTIKQAGSQARFLAIDRDIPVALARVAHAQGATRFAYVSSVGATEDARTFYLRSKGETETLLRNVGFESLTVLRPSLLLGDRDEFRLGERIGQGLGALTRPLWPARVRPVQAATVAAALVQAVREDHVGQRVVEGRALRDLAEGWRREVRG